MPNYKTIIYEKRGNVAWLTLNWPEGRNALSMQVKEDLLAALMEARDDSEVYLLVITGAGAAFCAGGDINAFVEATASGQLDRHGRVNPILFIRQVPKPVIAMINGMALGGGCEIVLSCDIAIAAEDAQFGQPEIRVGVIPGAGGTQLLPRLIGEKKAKDLIFTGRVFSAAEALQIGLVNQVVPREKLQEATEKYVATLLKRSPVLLKMAKLAVNRAQETTLATGLACESDLFSLCFSTEDQKEGAKAFLGKREPEYKGK